MNIFESTKIGLDISDHTIELIELEKNGPIIKVLNKNRLSLPVGVVVKGEIKDSDKLLEIIKKLFNEASPIKIKFRNIILGIPENLVYTHIFEVNIENKKNLKEVVEKEIKENIPMDESQVTYYYRILEKKEGNKKKKTEENKKTGEEIIIFVADKYILNSWQNFFKSLDVGIENFEIESQAIFRGIFNETKNAKCIVDTGAFTTNVSIFDEFDLHYSFTINIGGNNFTEKISQTFKIDIIKAEEYKKKINLKNKKDLECLSGPLNEIVLEIKESISYFENKYNKKIDEILLVGGSSQLVGLVDYYKKNLDRPVKIAESKIKNNNIPLEYLEAIGLALKGFDGKWFKASENFPIKNLQKNYYKKTEKSIGAVQINDDNFSNSEQENAKKGKLNFFQKIDKRLLTLLIIIFFGLILVSVSFWYRGKVEKDKQEKLKAIQNQFLLQEQSFDFEIPIAVKANEYSSDRVRGRIIKEVINEAENYEDAIKISKENTEKLLKEGEIIWNEPVSKTVFSDDNVFLPVTFEWLLLIDKEADVLFLENVKKINKNNASYILRNIRKDSIVPTENPDIYLLKGQITVESDKPIQ